MSNPTPSPTPVPFVDLRAQYANIRAEVHQAMDRVLQRTDFILGQDVEAFEEEFAAYCGARYSIGVDSGTSALELILRAYELGPGDEIIAPANTFIATVLAISYVGATPVLVDADPHTLSMDPALVEAAITPRTKAILPVHLYGHPAEMDAIMDIAHRHGLVVIEDASQAHGARYKGQRVGSLGHAAAFSLYPAKNLGAYGDAGILVTDDPQIADTLRMLRNYGQRVKYHHDLVGYNRRLDTLHAAVLRVKLRHLDSWSEARRRHAARYSQLLADVPGVTLPGQAADVEPVFHLYVIQVEQRDELRAFLAEQGIATGIHYPAPIHLQPAYRHLGYREGDFPVTEASARRMLSLPMYPELPEEAIQRVVQAIRAFQTQAQLSRAAV